MKCNFNSKSQDCNLLLMVHTKCIDLTICDNNTSEALTLGLSNTGFPLFSAIFSNRSVYVSCHNLTSTQSGSCQLKLGSCACPFATVIYPSASVDKEHAL